MQDEQNNGKKEQLYNCIVLLIKNYKVSTTIGAIRRRMEKELKNKRKIVAVEKRFFSQGKLLKVPRQRTYMCFFSEMYNLTIWSIEQSHCVKCIDSWWSKVGHQKEIQLYPNKFPTSWNINAMEKTLSCKKFLLLSFSLYAPWRSFIVLGRIPCCIFNGKSNFENGSAIS